ncbi:hypothetical protein B0H13DRAFT_1852273 [Mycena leptocephala]|nr:hypothetical protein B0H13DRAFT_1852273 [Mycena leptocephala]
MSDVDYDDAELFDGKQMVIDTIRDVPHAARKFLVTTPELEKKKATTKKCSNAMRQPSTSSSTGDESRKKRKTEVIDLDDDDDLLEPPTPAPTLKGPKAKSKTDDDVIKKGPFSLSSKDTYDMFLEKLASALPCRPQYIFQQKITWQPFKRKNATPLPLGAANGYPIMIAAIVKGQVGGTHASFDDACPSAAHGGGNSMLIFGDEVFLLTISQPWPTGADDDDEKHNKFDYSELESSGPANSVYEQQISFNKATKTERALLEETYPIDNYPAIDPNKRIFHDPKTDFYFDLNSSRMGVWCNAMASAKEDPWESRFFDANQRIKNTANNVHATASVALTSVAGTSLTAPVPAPAPASTPSLSDVLIASLLAQGGGLAALFPQLNPTAALAPPPPPATVFPVPDPVQPRTAPPSPVKRHSVSVERFCDDYDIDAVDCTRLSAVGFRPGDPTEPKPDEDLRDAGFSIFGWKRIHNGNLRFKVDLAAGRFDP